MKTLTFLSRQAPFGSSKAKACLDMVLASAVFEQQINYVFMDDGVWQLVRGHAPEAIGSKNTMAALSALELYGVDKVYALEESLTGRGLTPEHLQIPVIVCTKTQLQAIIKASDVVTAL
ncbi:MAG: sulfurtransferase complex subunit TusC [Pseudohongiella sp.]|nr:sulfurtransferase complex subunit TusC [Pseudohongiella sp.]MDP2127634.1 sulfurtransferase complex subunit TusC [Pseudohongiella sp.]